MSLLWQNKNKTNRFITTGVSRLIGSLILNVYIMDPVEAIYKFTIIAIMLHFTLYIASHANELVPFSVPRMRMR